MEAITHNQTLEINPNHPIIIKLNELRKTDSKRAQNIGMHMLEGVLLSSGIPFDVSKGAKRNLTLIDDYLKMKVDRLDSASKE